MGAKRQAYEANKRVWTLIHRKHKEGDIDYSKGQALKELGETKQLDNDCYLCDYCDQFDPRGHDCHLCPAVWPGKYCSEGDGSGLFDKWNTAETRLSKMRYAAMIRDLKMRK